MPELDTNSMRPRLRETIPSYVARLAASKGVAARDLCLDMGVSLKRMILLDKEAVAALARWANLGDDELEELLSWTGVSVGGEVRMRFRGEILGSRALRNPVMRGCHLCLAEDASSRPDAPLAAMVMRGEWQLRDSVICLRHKTPLAELWTEMTQTRRFDVGSRLSEIQLSLLSGRYDQPCLTPTPYDLWLDGRLANGTDQTWMKDISFYAITTICGLLGGELLQLESAAPLSTGPRHGFALARGLDVLRQGEAAFRESLDEMIESADGAQAKPLKAFGHLYSRLASDLLADSAFDPFRTVLRECILAHWAFDADETLLGELVRERRLHSVVTAARELGIGPGVLDAIVTDAGAFSLDDRRPLARKVFSVNDYAPLLAEIPTWVGPGAMMVAMKATKAAFAALEADGVLVPRTKAPKVLARWKLSDGLALVEELAAIASPMAVDSPRWESLQQAKKRSRVPAGAISAAVRSGAMVISQENDTPGYNGFRVRTTEVDALAARMLKLAPEVAEFSGSISAAAFGRKVGLRDGGMFLALAEAGHVQSDVVRHPKTGQAMHRMTDDHIAAFHEKFLTLATIEVEFGLQWNTVLAVLRGAGARRFELNGKAAGSIWLRSEIEGHFKTKCRP